MSNIFSRLKSTRLLKTVTVLLVSIFLFVTQVASPVQAKVAEASRQPVEQQSAKAKTEALKENAQKKVGKKGTANSQQSPQTSGETKTIQLPHVEVTASEQEPIMNKVGCSLHHKTNLEHPHPGLPH